MREFINKWHWRSQGAGRIIPPVQYRGVAYIYRMRPGRDEWTWTIHPPDGSPRTGEFTGTRGALIAQIETRIDNWFKIQRAAQMRREVNLPDRKEQYKRGRVRGS